MAGPYRMDWPTYAKARDYVAQHRIGTLMRDAERAEDSEFDAARKQLEIRR